MRSNKFKYYVLTYLLTYLRGIGNRHRWLGIMKHPACQNITIQ